MNYRIWMRYDEAGCEEWANDSKFRHLADAEAECEALQESAILGVEYEIIDLRTGYPAGIKTEDAKRLGLQPKPA